MIKNGKYVIPLWLIAILLISGITILVVAVLPSVIMPVEVHACTVKVAKDEISS